MIYTSNYQKHGNNVNSISISNSAPKFFKYDKFKLLVPNWNLVSDYKHGFINQDEYIERYYHKNLLHLDVDKIAEQLQNKILLCCEQKETDFCHRHIVREWFLMYDIQCKDL